MKNVVQFHKKKNYTLIPDGYRWCHNCGALTPHVRHDEFHGFDCCVCDNYSTDIICCPNCGADLPKDSAYTTTVIRHLPGCHFEDRSGEEKTEYSTRYWCMSWAERIMFEFGNDYMKNYPGLCCYSTKEDWAYMAEIRRREAAIKDYDERFKCGCPQFTIYKNIESVVVDGGSYPSMDCMNAYWWRYKSRCPICGFITIGEDTNC